jgi:hypothetical protein
VEDRFEFSYRRGTFLAERHMLVERLEDDAKSGSPFWRLSRAGIGIVSLPALPLESKKSVEARFGKWLEGHYYEISHLGVAYQVYRIPGDFWNPEKETPEPPGVWDIRREDDHITQFPEDNARSLEAAITVFAREIAEQAVECFGGPLDGERVGERGESFRAMSERDDELDEGRISRIQEPQRGVYRRATRGYEWQPD